MRVPMILLWYKYQQRGDRFSWTLQLFNCSLISIIIYHLTWLHWYVCLFVCVSFQHISVITYTRTHTCKYTRLHTLTHTHTHCMYLQAYSYTHICTREGTHIHTRTHYTYVHLYTHTYTHTGIHNSSFNDYH